MIPIQLNLPESITSITKGTPEEFVQELRLAAAVKWYEVGTVSESQACEIAGISCQAFREALDRFGVSPYVVGVRQAILKQIGDSPLPVSPEELESEISCPPLSGPLTRFIGAAKGNYKSVEEIDQFIREERDSWKF